MIFLFAYFLLTPNEKLIHWKNKTYIHVALSALQFFTLIVWYLKSALDQRHKDKVHVMADVSFELTHHLHEQENDFVTSASRYIFKSRIRRNVSYSWFGVQLLTWEKTVQHKDRSYLLVNKMHYFWVQLHDKR